MSLTRPRRLLTTALVLELAAGCHVGLERSGDERFRKSALPSEGRDGAGAPVTAADVAAAIGPPTDIRIAGDELWFIYRFRELRKRELYIRFYVDLFRWSRAQGVDSALIVIFDRDDRLLYTAMTERPPE